MYLLFLVLCVFRNEQRETLVDATLLEELLKLFLEGKVESFELTKTNTIHPKTRSRFQRERMADAPGDRYKVRGVSNQPRG